MIKLTRGFTLIELLITLVIVSILVAMALPSYQRYQLKKDRAVAQQEALKIANELERFKAKNFSYKGFNPNFLYNTTGVTNYDASKGELSLPLGAGTADVKYILTLVDPSTKKPLTETSAAGMNWAISVQRASGNGGLKQPQNYDLLINSAGVRCMTNATGQVSTLVSCGDKTESWS